MKQVILLLVFILSFTPAYAVKNPFKSCPEATKLQQCYHRIKLSPTIEYIFLGGCETVKQIGVIFTNKRKILFLDLNQRIMSEQSFTDINIMEETKKKSFPDVKDIELKIFRENEH